MPNFEHLVELERSKSFRTEKIVGMFDVPPADVLKRSWVVDMPIEDEPWNVGLIVGPSGGGKTTIAKRAFPESSYFEKHEWGKTAFVDAFDESLPIKEIVDSLSHVGFSSPPSWLLPYTALSNGQQFRADLARAILENELVVFDEFTSFVDRTVAKVGSFAVQKFARKMKRQFVAVTCHYDVMEWLEPDWVYDVSDGKFTRRSLRRPPISFEIKRVHHSAWKLFKGHHYLNNQMNKAARVYVGSIEGQPAAMTAILPLPYKGVRNCWKEHRTVVLPDFQGIGLGNRLSEHVGDLLLADSKRYRTTTSHPAMIHYRNKSPKWRLTRKPSMGGLPGKKGHRKAGTKGNRVQNIKNVSTGRLTASFEYVGDKVV